ncbi:MAG: hypothetical protein ACLFWM_07925 [Actinomycetota bacterium]
MSATNKEPDPSPARYLPALAVVLLIVAACGDRALSIAEWERVWEATTATISQAKDGGITDQECNDTLGYLREQKTRLIPTPLEDLEDPVESWFELSESAFFECAFGQQEVREGAPVFERLQTFQTSVRSVLAGQS